MKAKFQVSSFQFQAKRWGYEVGRVILNEPSVRRIKDNPPYLQK